MYPAFFIAPAINPRTVCFCQPILAMISESVAPFLRWSITSTCAVLLPSRGPAVSCALAAFLPLGSFLAAVAFLVALAFAGAPLAAGAPTLAFLSAFASADSAARKAQCDRRSEENEHEAGDSKRELLVDLDSVRVH